ncbi:MAG: dihydroorotase [Elusimicrobia bacterium]|nr:dihydroorotase [Candidatus Liberimonas magnetica]
MKLLIRGGLVVDPETKLNNISDILINNGRIEQVKNGIKADGAVEIDAKGKVVIPGLIDVHTHLREPGHEEEETIASGTRAAAHGGVTSVFCMPNTHPPLDNAPAVEFVLLKAQKEGIVNVFPIGCITKGSNGEELAEIGVLKKSGIIAISDDGNTVMNSQVMRRALEYTKMFDIPVISHCEDTALTKNGVMNEGYTSMVLGLRGIPTHSEDIIVSRDIMLAELSSGHLHIAHVSTKESVDLIRQAKKRKIKVTAETCPHYFSLTEEDVKKTNYDTNTKMKPPLRTREDVSAIIEGLKDGTIDCIATDHAPHTIEEKNKEYDLAPFGIIGLETLLSLVVTELVNKKVMTLSEAVSKMTINPARIFNLKDRGSLKKGNIADITIIDIKKNYVIRKEDFVSKSKNSPFVGRTLAGFVEKTIVGGEVVWPIKEETNR